MPADSQQPRTAGDRSAPPNATPLRAWPPPEAILRAGVIAAAAAVAAQSAAHLLWGAVWPAELINADSDAGVFAWASSAGTYTVSVAAVCAAVVDGRRLAAWLVLAFACAALSLDDVVAVHERLGGVADAIGLWNHANRAVGLILIAPLLGVVFCLSWWLTRPIPLVNRRVGWGLVLLAAAVVCEAIGSQLIRRAGFSGTEAPYLAEVIVEEGLELAGWIVLASALAALPRAFGATDRDPPLD